MPGYELSQFVDLSEIEKQELTCGICQDIFRCPIVTDCCLQTFCRDCIMEWLRSNKTCPFDRKVMFKSQLTQPPRLLMNMLSQLKIQCNYREFGCNEVLLLENYENHSIICQFKRKDINECERCYCELGLNHDCVESLLNVINEMIEENIALRKKHKKEKRTLLRTIEDMTRTGNKITNPEKLFESIFKWISLKQFLSLLLIFIMIMFFATIFQKTLIEYYMKDSNPLSIVEFVVNKSEFYAIQALNWILTKALVFWDSFNTLITISLKFFWKTFLDLMLYLWNSTKFLRQLIDTYIPLCLETISDLYLPQMMTTFKMLWRESQRRLSNWILMQE